MIVRAHKPQILNRMNVLLLVTIGQCNMIEQKIKKKVIASVFFKKEVLREAEFII